MATARIIETGITPDEYDQMRERLGMADTPPPGGRFHVAAIGEDHLMVPTITVPVLLVLGANDALFPPPAGTEQQAQFLGSSDVSLIQLPNTGHALTLERSAPTFTADISRWLAARGF